MRKLNPFQKLLAEIALFIIGILLHSVFYMSLLFFTSMGDVFVADIHTQSLWAVWAVATFLGLWIDILLLLVGAAAWFLIVSPLGEAYKKSYPKQPKKSYKEFKKDNKIDTYKKSLLN